MTAVGGRTNVVSVEPGDNWGERLARAIDEEIAVLSPDRDVISVAVTPIRQESAGFRLERSATLAVLVTVVWSGSES